MELDQLRGKCANLETALNDAEGALKLGAIQIRKLEQELSRAKEEHLRLEELERLKGEAGATEKALKAQLAKEQASGARLADEIASEQRQRHEAEEALKTSLHNKALQVATPIGTRTFAPWATDLSPRPELSTITGPGRAPRAPVRTRRVAPGA